MNSLFHEPPTTDGFKDISPESIRLGTITITYEKMETMLKTIDELKRQVDLLIECVTLLDAKQ